VVWKAIAASEIGTAHQKRNQPCQDYADFCLLDGDVLVGAVSDGAGSAMHSEQGSRLAVKAILNYFQVVSEHRQENINHSPLSYKVLQKIFGDVLEKVKKDLQELADENNYYLEDLACTLLVFIATPLNTMAMQIGDGFLVVRTPDGPYKLLFEPDKGEYANETTFVTSDSALKEMRVTLIEEPISFICASTDGLEKVAIKFSDYSPYDRFFNPLYAYLQETTEPKQEEYLIPFLQLPDLNKRTDDDKTLLIASFEG